MFPLQQVQLFTQPLNTRRESLLRCKNIFSLLTLMSCRKSTQAHELKHWLQGKVRERTAEAVGMIWDMLPITEKTKDEIDFSKVPEGVKIICYCFISDTELTSGKDQPVPVCVHAWQKRLSLEELLENERKVKYLRVSVEFGEDFLFQ